jgi:hypothetical protein
MKTGTGADSGAGRSQLAPWMADLRRLPEPALRNLGPALATSVLPFALIVYLSLKSGGYDIVVYSQVGIAAWWLILLGALIGVLPVARVPRMGWVALGVLAAFAVWTALGIGWSESAERSAEEVGRLAAYLGVFALALAVQGRDGLRRTVYAVGAAIVLVGGLALLSRLHPEWFPADRIARVTRVGVQRLNYPLDYWNGLAALIGMGIPLILVAAAQARTLLAQALAAAAVPALALTLTLTSSRGGIAAAVVGLIAFAALYPRWLALLPTLVLAGGGSAILIAAAIQRPAFADGLRTAPAYAQGDEMLAMTIVVCAGAALVQVAVGLSGRYRVGPRPSVSRRTTLSLIGGAAAAMLVAGLVAGAPGELSDRWEKFKQPGGAGHGVARLESAEGNFRYQVWQSGLDANATDPITGIGPGTFEYWWARNRELDTFVRDGHSLYLETLAEAGIVGLALVLGLIGIVLASGARGAFAGGEERRAMVAAATAACGIFAVAATIDWLWELPVLPVAFLVLSAAILAAAGARGAHRREASGLPPSKRRSIAVRAAAAVLSIACVVAIASPMAGAMFVRASQQQVDAGELGSALESARDAHRYEPFAARPLLQEALVLELGGHLDGAADAARRATAKEPVNWRNWIVLARIEARRRDHVAAEHAYEEAYSSNPRSDVLASIDERELQRDLRTLELTE